MKKFLAAPLLVAFLFTGCAKEGLDGDATLVIKPAHHGDAIASSAAYRDSVFIKFGATEIPTDPTHDYDALVVGEVGEDHIHVEHVKWGEYSVYCTGWDTIGTPDRGRVRGGVLVKIKRKDRKQEITIDVPVTE